MRNFISNIFKSEKWIYAMILGALSFIALALIYNATEVPVQWAVIFNALLGMIREHVVSCRKGYIFFSWRNFYLYQVPGILFILFI